MATVFAAVGFPGSGKSTCFQALSSIIQGSQWISADLCGPRFLKEIKESKATYIFADRCHHNVKNRQETIAAAENRRIVWIVFHHPEDDLDDVTRTFDICKTRVMKRSDHPTLNAKNCTLAMNTIRKYYQPITCKEKGLTVILDITDTVENHIKFILGLLK